MPAANTMSANKVYTLSMIAPAILQGDITGTFLYSTPFVGLPNDVKQSIVTTYAAVYPTLPTGTTNDAASGSYYAIMLPSGRVVYLSEQWVTRIVEVGQSSYTFVVQGIDVVLAEQVNKAILAVIGNNGRVTMA